MKVELHQSVATACGPRGRPLHLGITGPGGHCKALCVKEREMRAEDASPVNGDGEAWPENVCRSPGWTRHSTAAGISLACICGTCSVRTAGLSPLFLFYLCLFLSF